MCRDVQDLWARKVWSG